MKATIKNKTIELLTLTKMEHLFNENDFKYYFKKLTKNKGNYNENLLSYSIVDNFKFNQITTKNK